ncbi:hypothetical protein [Geodermatophilus normandii]|uniref:Universal stress protein n=1 Tax=Geodermatophilus normandii TaxID=1137989 RepID=A0A6P0GJA2_9ACTN|nr:hypothetical protein [Geodermatophilus normandii]NEM07232.1 hypothetical protein [Geodermatophilus normandii]
MTVLSPAPPLAPAPAPAGRPAPDTPRRILAVVTGRQGARAVLDEAHRTALDTGQEVHTALVLPRPPFVLDAALLARLTEEADREEGELVGLVLQRASAAGVATRLSIHRPAGLRGRRRRRVLDRTVARLARRLDAVPIGWPAP